MVETYEIKQNEYESLAKGYRYRRRTVSFFDVNFSKDLPSPTYIFEKISFHLCIGATRNNSDRQSE